MKYKIFKLNNFLLLTLAFLSVVFVTKEVRPAMLYALEQGEQGEELDIIVGELKAVAVSSPTRVSVADPSVADIEKATEKEVLIIAKARGTTILTVWDKTGERSILIRVSAENLEGLQERLSKLLSNFKIEKLNLNISKEEGKVVITGDYLEDDKEGINSVLSPLADRIINLMKAEQRDDLVQIDVQILELSKSAARELGIEWLQSLQIREEPYSSSTATSGVATSHTTTDTLANVFRVVEWSRDALTAKIHMLESENRAKVLSRPKLVCLSGKEAEFVVGGELPIVTTATTAAGTTQTNVEYRKYGVVLKIKPVVMGKEQINTQIKTEVSDVASWRTIGSSSYPVMTTNTATTELYLRDGETVFLAGLIKNSLSKDNVSRMPILGRIPFLGAFFRWRDYSKADSEIVISITPSIIKQPQNKTTPQDLAAAQKAEVSIGVPPGANAAAASSAKLEPPNYLSIYARLVQDKIARGIQYPEDAKQFGWEGEVTLRLQLLSDGNLSKVDIKDSSGYDVFDNTALETAKLQAPYPSFPPELEAHELRLDVPIVYSIK